MPAVDCLLLRVARLAGLMPAPSSQIRSAAVAPQKLLKLCGISQGHCFVHRLGALIPRRHLASPVQGGDRAAVEILSQRRWGLFVP